MDQPLVWKRICSVANLDLELKGVGGGRVGWFCFAFLVSFFFCDFFFFTQNKQGPGLLAPPWGPGPQLLLGAPLLDPPF